MHRCVCNNTGKIVKVREGVRISVCVCVGGGGGMERRGWSKGIAVRVYVGAQVNATTACMKYRNRIKYTCIRVSQSQHQIPLLKLGYAVYSIKCAPIKFNTNKFVLITSTAILQTSVL